MGIVNNSININNTNNCFTPQTIEHNKTHDIYSDGNPGPTPMCNYSVMSYVLSSTPRVSP
jgi:hypothetical protein